MWVRTHWWSADGRSGAYGVAIGDTQEVNIPEFDAPEVPPELMRIGPPLGPPGTIVLPDEVRITEFLKKHKVKWERVPERYRFR